MDVHLEVAVRVSPPPPSSPHQPPRRPRTAVDTLSRYPHELQDARRAQCAARKALGSIRVPGTQVCLCKGKGLEWTSRLALPSVVDSCGSGYTPYYSRYYTAPPRPRRRATSRSSSTRAWSRGASTCMVSRVRIAIFFCSAKRASRAG